MRDERHGSGGTAVRAPRAMSLRQMLLMLVGIAVAMTALALCIQRLGVATSDVAKAHEVRYTSYLLADWDFRAAGIHPRRGEEPAAALTNLMKCAGFTADEFAKLNESERNSNDLVRTETMAMNMVEGHTAPSTGAAAQAVHPTPPALRR